MIHTDREKTEAFEDLEDARDELARYRFGLHSAFLVIALGVASILAGAWLQEDYVTTALVWVGIGAVCTSVSFAGAWALFHLDVGSDPNPYQKVRAAQRKYNNLLVTD